MVWTPSSSTDDIAGVSNVRCLELDGAYNVRDIGGYPTKDGRTVRWRRAYRADSLHLLSERDMALIADLGLVAIYDLRKPHERTRFPTRLPTDHGHGDVHLDVYDDPDAPPGPELMDQLASGTWSRRSNEQMIGSYTRMLTVGAPTFGRLLTALAKPDGVPAMFHCAAGKDRTGVAAALILSILGVDREVVIEDYAATNTFRTGRYVERVRADYDAVGIDVEQIRAIIDARPCVLAGALDWIVATFGGVTEYLVKEARVEPHTIRELRAALIE